MLDVATALDKLDLRCPRLGGSVTFGYCRKMSEGLPCSRSLVCWQRAFPVEEYMLRALTPEEWRKVFETPAAPRMEVLLKAASQASGQMSSSS